MHIKTFYKKKLNNKNGESNIHYLLFRNLDKFNSGTISLSTTVSSFLNKLWNSPEITHNILLNSDIEIVKTNLAPFICNNFYCNYLSGNYMENNLLYIITKMLKDEIDKLEI